ncbi:MAG TPA: sodium/proline symporter PutP [Bacillales bacterium]|nr:sodium/proline symporter PutP [Bacillales bacterium]
METGTVISLAVYMVGMLAIGYWSYRKTSTLSDYMLGGRGLGPWVTALSAGASDMSSWMVMGLPGALYATGLSSAWIAIGLTIGAYVNYLVVAPRLRTYTEIANDSITIPDFMENRFGDKSNVLRLVSGIIILIFFTLYVSSGMVAGGKLFDSAFGLSYHAGVFITAAVVVAYTLFGGFLAVSTTDFVQGCIMFVALVMVPFVAVTHVGGTDNAIHIINSIDPTRLDLFKGATTLGIIGFFAWGLGYFGQPHIVVRFMAIKSAKELKAARYINITWMGIGLLGAMAVGLLGIAYFAQHGGKLDDPETVLIQFADIFFNPYITGFILAAILAATMSTVSSQLLVSSSAVTEDFYKTFFRRNASEKELVFVGRAAVLAVAIVAVLLSINPNETILNIVGQAWAGFGSAFGSVILVGLHWKRMTRWGALAGMIVGGLTVIIWITTGLSGYLYEMVPGFLLSLAAIFIVSKLTAQPSDSVKEQFEEMEKEMA